MKTIVLLVGILILVNPSLSAMKKPDLKKLISLSNDLSARQKVEAQRMFYRKIEPDKIITNKTLDCKYFSKAFDILKNNRNVIDKIRIEGKKKDSWLAKIDEYKNLLEEIYRVFEIASSASCFPNEKGISLEKVCQKGVSLYVDTCERCFALEELSLHNRCFDYKESYNNKEIVGMDREKKLKECVSCIAKKADVSMSLSINPSFQILRISEIISMTQ